MRVLIADDEAHARRRLARLLGDLGVEVVAAFEDGAGLVAALPEHAPDAIFLDIDMPGLDGLSAAAEASLSTGVQVVFVSGHRELAVEAFDIDAVDFILKPVSKERLERALDKVRARRRTPQASARDITEASAQSSTQSSAQSSAKEKPWLLRVVDGGLERLVDAREVEVFRAMDKYTALRAGGRELLTRQSLSELEQQLDGLGFVRVRRDALVRVDAVEAVQRSGGLELVLRSGERVSVARRAVAEVKRVLGI